MRELIQQTIQRARNESSRGDSLLLAAELIRLARLGSALHMSQAAGLLRPQIASDREIVDAAEAKP